MIVAGGVAYLLAGALVTRATGSLAFGLVAPMVAGAMAVRWLLSV
jgi:hypothetical protein